MPPGQWQESIQHAAAVHRASSRAVWQFTAEKARSRRVPFTRINFISIRRRHSETGT